MELNLIIDILKLVVPTVIAVVSLYYAIRQRSLVKTEISKKRYLESAQSNLNEAIKFLRGISLPDISRLNEGFETWADMYNDSFTMTSEVLRASFELKKKKIPLEVCYEIIDYGEYGKPESEKVESKTIRDFDAFQPDWFINYFRTHIVRISSRWLIPNFEQFWSNTVDFDYFEWGLNSLKDTIDTLLVYEEVYENVSPDSVEKVNQLYEHIAEEIFEVICKPKRIEIDLEKFSNVHEIMEYLVEKILNYSYIASRFSKVSELISELTKGRRELFLKIT